MSETSAEVALLPPPAKPKLETPPPPTAATTTASVEPASEANTFSAPTATQPPEFTPPTATAQTETPPPPKIEKLTKDEVIPGAQDKNYYQVLGINFDVASASEAQLTEALTNRDFTAEDLQGKTRDQLVDSLTKNAFRTAASALHPDRPNPYIDRQAQEELFKRIGEANDVLNDPVKRTEYDSKLAEEKARQAAGMRQMAEEHPATGHRSSQVNEATDWAEAIRHQANPELQTFYEAVCLGIQVEFGNRTITPVQRVNETALAFVQTVGPQLLEANPAAKILMDAAAKKEATPENAKKFNILVLLMLFALIGFDALISLMGDEPQKIFDALVEYLPTLATAGAELITIPKGPVEAKSAKPKTETPAAQKPAESTWQVIKESPAEIAAPSEATPEIPPAPILNQIPAPETPPPPVKSKEVTQFTAMVQPENQPIAVGPNTLFGRTSVAVPSITSTTNKT